MPENRPADVSPRTPGRFPRRLFLWPVALLKGWPINVAEEEVMAVNSLRDDGRMGKESLLLET